MWMESKLGPHKYHLLNLDHPRVEAAILDEMEAGVDVYYDRRWDVTEAFCYFLINQPDWITNRSVLVLGAGIGMETVVIGRLAKKLYLNDLAPIALELCGRQLRKNGLNSFELIPGRYEAIEYPPVDIALGCFLIYNPDTAQAMSRFLENCPSPLLLMNEPMPPFQKFLRNAKKPIRYLNEDEAFPCILFQ